MTSSPRLLIAAVVLLVVRSAASPRSINDAPREVDRRVHVGNGWETARKPRIPGKVLEAKLVNELTYLCTLHGGRRLSGLGCNVICFLLERACKCQCSLSAVVLRPPAATMHDVEERDDVARVLALVECGLWIVADRATHQWSMLQRPAYAMRTAGRLGCCPFERRAARPARARRCATARRICSGARRSRPDRVEVWNVRGHRAIMSGHAVCCLLLCAVRGINLLLVRDP